MTAPAISVVMTVRDGERFLGEAIDSVLTQTLEELELIVVDDGSTDSSGAVAAARARRDRRVRVVTLSRVGRVAALNEGFASARARLVAILDADDVASPTRLARQAEHLASNPRVAAVGGAVRFVTAAGEPFADVRYPLSHREIEAALELTSPLAHPAATIRRTAFEDVGGYRQQFVAGAEDVDMWLRLAERYELANLPDIAICYRVHRAQTTARSFEAQTIEAVAARAAARVRREGARDPLEDVERIDADLLCQLGVQPHEVTEAIVRAAAWMAKTLARASDAAGSAALFALAEAAARSDCGSAALERQVEEARRAVGSQRTRPWRRWRS